jgi:hypothetical protein
VCPPCSPVAAPAELQAIVMVIVVIVVVVIVVIAYPPHGTITIADAIMIPSLGWHIVGSAMAMALLFLGGWAINTKVK